MLVNQSFFQVFYQIAALFTSLLKTLLTLSKSHVGMISDQVDNEVGGGYNSS